MSGKFKKICNYHGIYWQNFVLSFRKFKSRFFRGIFFVFYICFLFSFIKFLRENLFILRIPRLFFLFSFHFCSWIGKLFSWAAVSLWLVQHSQDWVSRQIVTSASNASISVVHRLISDASYSGTFKKTQKVLERQIRC